MIQLERVRCVDAKGALFLDVGRTYNVVLDCGDTIFVLGGRTSGGMGRYAKRRFKPVVRVKAKCVPSLSVLIKRAVAAVERMTPAERASMDKAQRESWARGEAGLGLD